LFGKPRKSVKRPDASGRVPMLPPLASATEPPAPPAGGNGKPLPPEMVAQQQGK